MEGILVFLALFATTNSEFFDTAVKQQQQGYEWTQLEECRAPNKLVPTIDMITGTGRRLVCYKLIK